MREEIGPTLRPVAEAARSWLFDDALPLWWDVGGDHVRGGFHERLTLAGVPTDDARRAFVQARQAVCYAEAGRLGWDGPWAAACAHGIEFLLHRYRRPDGAVAHAVSPDGTVVSDAIDLYDQAFAIFACARVYETLGRPEEVRNAANGVLAFLERHRRHPVIGFEEDDPPRLPLRQNPAMHLLEAALAWVEASDDARWWDLAERLVRLATTRLIGEQSGALFEVHDAAWGRWPDGDERTSIVEPGHQYEWTWLLSRWSALSGQDTAEVRQRLYDFAEAYGRDRRRGIVVHDVDGAGRQKNRMARIWGQTERLRAALVMAGSAPPQLRAPHVAGAVEACLALEAFLDVPVAGLWRDKWREDGSFVDEACPASSLYHLVTGYKELILVAGEASPTDARLAAPAPDRAHPPLSLEHCPS